MQVAQSSALRNAEVFGVACSTVSLKAYRQCVRLLIALLSGKGPVIHGVLSKEACLVCGERQCLRKLLRMLGKPRFSFKLNVVTVAQWKTLTGHTYQAHMGHSDNADNELREHISHQS